MNELVTHQMRTRISSKIIPAIDLGFDPKIADPVSGLSQSINRSIEKIRGIASQELTAAALQIERDRIATELEQSLINDTWRGKFKGRDVLKRFAGKHINGLPYIAFRDAILARMCDAGYKPSGMQTVIDKILST